MCVGRRAGEPVPESDSGSDGFLLLALVGNTLRVATANLVYRFNLHRDASSVALDPSQSVGMYVN